MFNQNPQEKVMLPKFLEAPLLFIYSGILTAITWVDGIDSDLKVISLFVTIIIGLFAIWNYAESALKNREQRRRMKWENDRRIEAWELQKIERLKKLDQHED